MKRKVYLLLLAVIIFVCFPMSAAKEYNKNAEVQTMNGDKTDLKSLDYEKVTYLCVKEPKDSIPNGWKLRQKVVTEKEDIKLIVDYLNSIDYKDITQETVFGLGQIVELRTDKVYYFVFTGDRVNMNGIYSGINIQDDEELKRIYETLSYNEEPAKP